MNETNANGKAKDTVFRDMFSQPKYAFQLYQALHPEDTKATIDDIKNVTIKRILTTDIYNDLGFSVGDRIIIMAEAQSTWSVNIITRLFLYFAETVKEYIIDNELDIYGRSVVNIPKAEFYVIYCGKPMEKVDKEYITFQNEIMNGVDSAVDVKVKVIKDESKDNILGQYFAFVRILYMNFERYGKTRKAVEETVRKCLEENLLKDYMKEREKEVIDMMSLIFSQEEVDRIRDHNNIKLGEARNLVEIVEHIAQANHISIAEACQFAGRSESDYENAKALLKDDKIAV